MFCCPGKEGGYGHGARRLDSSFVLFSRRAYVQAENSTFLALLILSIAVPLIAGAPISGPDSLLTVLDKGSYALASSILALLFGAWLGEVMNETGITKDIIRRASELGGDKPLAVAIIMSAVVALLFTSLTGLGSHIMVGMLVLPIFSAVGIKPLLGSCILIMARTTGIIFNMSQWQLYMNVSKLTVDPIKSIAATTSICSAIVLLFFILYNLKLKPRAAWAMPSVSGSVSGNVSEGARKLPLIALLTPFVPFPLVIFLKWPIIPALLVGVVFGTVTAAPRDIFRVLTKTVHEAVKAAAPALVLMVTIGMLLAAVNLPSVKGVILSVAGPLLPDSAMSYAVFFIVLAPLALYRGPLNLWGMGSGVIGLMIAAQTMSPLAVVAGFIAVQAIQLSSCPTNTHNVWTADFHNLEVNDITKKSLPFMWIVTAMAVLVAAYRFF